MEEGRGEACQALQRSPPGQQRASQRPQRHGHHPSAFPVMGGALLSPSAKPLEPELGEGTSSPQALGYEEPPPQGKQLHVYRQKKSPLPSWRTLSDPTLRLTFP